MDFEIPEKLALQLLDKIEQDSPLAAELKSYGICHGRVMVSSKLFDGYALNTLYNMCKADGPRALTFQLLALDNIHRAPNARTIPGIEKLINGLIAFFARDAIDGWVYQRSKDGVLLPWVVHGMRHVIPPQGKEYVVVSLLANTMVSANRAGYLDHRKRHTGMTTTIMFDTNDIADKTIPELLAENGFYKECEEFKQEYELQAKRFLKLQKQFGEQFVIREGMYLQDMKENFDYIRFPMGGSVKCVNDEEILERRFEATADNTFWTRAGVEGKFNRIPLHCYLHLFHLELHTNVWVHVQNVEAYQYRPELREKLILPQDHRDLIDILTADLDVLMDDFVEGKSGGTTILCMGSPGLGKTLTAEIYSEVVKKPLYRVHSGQLGITAQTVEANLSRILRRAERWGAILLLDEADVYIRRRDNDLQHNAIVAEFLRTLEYFNGLMFMTTNRNEDVDDAILSRCIALIKYEVPPQEAALRLWESLARQLGADMPQALIEEMVDTFPEASGRDIKELLKLTIKYCKGKQQPLNAAAFKLCAVFRGLA